jgi:hypothetical protein
LNTANQAGTDEIGDIGGSKRTKNKRRRQMAGPYNTFGQQAIEDEQPCMLGFVSCDSQSSGDQRRQRNGDQPMKQNRTNIRPPPNSEPAHSEFPCLELLQRHPPAPLRRYISFTFDVQLTASDRMAFCGI